LQCIWKASFSRTGSPHIRYRSAPLEKFISEMRCSRSSEYWPPVWAFNWSVAVCGLPFVYTMAFMTHHFHRWLAHEVKNQRIETQDTTHQVKWSEVRWGEGR
jgi:hypothetical protein